MTARAIRKDQLQRNARKNCIKLNFATTGSTVKNADLERCIFAHGQHELRMPKRKI